ncbi:MAG TPA: iron-sulfur cluster insertion protein ErpA [Candidatus Polarisedimenticolia bacterium]|jgi:iron-sulfur cluster assembly protein|nr:iron-sulfur cluster insertion protein ErpA [Candidatus Polarisedimenticolia bacterium]
MIGLTEKAAQEVKTLMANENLDGYGLRVSVAGGGCSGLSYRLLFEKEAGKEDRVFEHHGVKVIVDAKSYLYLNGTTVDYSDGLNGTGFTFTNPNASGTCGCGTSFHT